MTGKEQIEQALAEASLHIAARLIAAHAERIQHAGALEARTLIVQLLGRAAIVGMAMYADRPRDEIEQLIAVPLDAADLEGA